MKPPYREACPRNLAVIGRRLIEHCLAFFADPHCVGVTIGDDELRIDLNKEFQETFLTKASEHKFKAGENLFKLRGFRLYKAQETQHELLYAADSREVLKENLGKYLPNLQRKLNDENGLFAYVGFIEGDYLNNHVSSDRTSFTFPSETSAADLFRELSLQEIRDSALDVIATDLQPFFEEINTEKLAVLDRFIKQEAPQYGALKRYVSEFIDDLPPNANSPRALDEFLHRQKYEKEKELKEESDKLLQGDKKLGLRPSDYEDLLRNFIERQNELGKSSLAQYIAHRKIMIDFLEKSLQADPANGRYSLEEIVHQIIYPMRATSDEVPYDQQNLWIIDERLTHHWYLVSDKRLDKVAILESKSHQRPDLLIFGLPPEKRHENELESVTERRRTHASESIQRRADHRDIARA